MAQDSFGEHRKACEASIQAALDAGIIDSTAQALPISQLRTLSDLMDDPEWPIVGGKYDNVTPAMLLKTEEALGILPDVVANRRKAAGGAKESPLLKLRVAENGRKKAQA